MAGRRVDRAFLEEAIDDFKQRFYVYGPPLFMVAVNKALTELGASAENMVFEQWVPARPKSRRV